VVILAADNHRWRKLCAIMGRPELGEDVRYAKLSGRSKNRDEIDALIGEWTGTRTRSELMGLLTSNDIICGVVKELPEVMTDPHLLERDALQQIVHPQLGPVTIFTSPLRFNGQASRPHSPSPLLGAANDLVYREELGLSAEEFASLRERKII
jgi:crotonobetainyl-CoA:carnitine CoA-transferase CaiB-like acyl-CoA transferase